MTPAQALYFAVAILAGLAVYGLVVVAERRRGER